MADFQFEILCIRFEISEIQIIDILIWYIIRISGENEAILKVKIRLIVFLLCYLHIHVRIHARQMMRVNFNKLWPWGCYISSPSIELYTSQKCNCCNYCLCDIHLITMMPSPISIDLRGNWDGLMGHCCYSLC